MSDGTFSKEQVTALEKILGVKLPEQGFTLEVKPLGGASLDDGQLDQVVGGVGAPQAASNLAQKVNEGLGQIPIIRWSCKI